MCEAENFRRTLDFEAMNFFYDGMLSRILEDAKDQAERFGFGIGTNGANVTLIITSVIIALCQRKNTLPYIVAKPMTYC